MLEKDGDQLDRSCEKCKSVTKGQVGEEYPKTIRKKIGNSTDHILFRNCLLKHVIEGKTETRMEVTERRGKNL